MFHHDEEVVGGGGGAATTTMTCEDVVRWVLLEAYARSRGGIHNHNYNNEHYDTTLDNPLLSSTCADYDNNNNNNNNDNHKEIVRRLQIQKEWKDGKVEEEETAASTTDIVLRRLDPNYRHDPTLFPQIPITTTTATDARTDLLTPSELLALGSVWQLPHNTLSIDDKPTRLNIGHTDDIAKPGDYFRIHFDPRRFVDANKYDWGKLCVVNDNDDNTSSPHGGSNSSSNHNNKPGVIVSRNDDAGYIIINKPPNVPVHSRVDNSLENVASCIGRMLLSEEREKKKKKKNLKHSMLAGSNDNNSTTSKVEHDEDDNEDGWHHKKRRRRMNQQQQKKKIEPLIYVGTPQRLDQNTSGLLVVATKKTFASYFAGLLQSKTRDQLRRSTRIGGVHKSYRCLVCILVPTTTRRMMPTTEKDEIDRLGQYTTLRHYLEPSIRSPKRFVSTIPEDAVNVDSWAECLLRITRIGQACSVEGRQDDGSPSASLSRALWGEYGIPENCMSVVEVEVELLTGRTHQIRGQLAAEGFPLVGDVQYGGAIPTSSDLYRERCAGRCEGFLDSESLALQCCSLEFLDPRRPPLDDDSRRDSEEQCWNKFRLESAFWTPYLEQYNNDVATMSASEELSTYGRN
jgi:23S rRNA-/tRNA-specific pseudouridylate synthase